MIKKFSLIFIFLTLLLTSCISKKYPIPDSNFWGVLITCTVDSTALTNEKIVRIKTGIRCKNGPCQHYTNKSCKNVPDYVSILSFWPSSLSLDFKKKSYSIIHSPKPLNPDNDFRTDKFPVAYKLDVGSLKYNKEKNEISLTSNIYSWTQTYKLSYSILDSVLTMESKNGY